MQPGDTTGDTNLSTVSMQPMTADATRVAKNLQSQIGDEITDVTALLYLSASSVIESKRFQILSGTLPSKFPRN